ncbi:hypothetical protein [Nocardia cyriacigeorgica]|uniref:Uncharacterized protein n=1 Tax=Nocardia cyriacigeorgica TaxID=135487 RepID=A0A4U8VSR8_9NOCA|nr:hypothetical protein [Nocardia cyriacigeorgica]VFA96616.1 Uncharacterised protein [Nocardia cyriacigeorgica]
MAVGYRAILRLDDKRDAVDVAEQHLRSWLHEKRTGRNKTVDVDDWEGAGVHRLGPSSELHVVHEDHERDNSRRRLYRLIETNDGGAWTVSMYVASLPNTRDNHHQTIVVDVDRDGVDRSEALATVDPPRLMRLILGTESATDGAVVLTGTPVAIRRGGAREVYDAIVDPERTASVVVAGSLGPEFDLKWQKVVESLTRQSMGVAATYVVFDDAMRELADLLPESYQPGPGRIRTYFPQVDLEDPTDALRHRWLGPVTLQRAIRGTQVSPALGRRHAEPARRRFVELELPTDIRRTIELLDRAETAVTRRARVSERVESRTAAAVPVTDQPLTRPELAVTAQPWWERVALLIRRWVGSLQPKLADLDRLDSFIEEKVAETQVAEEQLSEAADREQAMQHELQTLRSRIDDMELDLALAEQESIENERVQTELRRRLIASNRPEDTYVAPDSNDIWSPPDSVEELLARITRGMQEHQAIQYVEFTGDLDRAIEIDVRYRTGLYSKHLWQFIRVLYDYATIRTQGYAGNVHSYLTDDKAEGAKCPMKSHASRESESVHNNKAWRSERVFPVPSSVDEAREVLMEAHFKPPRRDTFAPRMHYFDDTGAGRSGKVYIGYVGRHLSTKHTISA